MDYSCYYLVAGQIWDTPVGLHGLQLLLPCCWPGLRHSCRSAWTPAGQGTSPAPPVSPGPAACSGWCCWCCSRLNTNKIYNNLYLWTQEVLQLQIYQRQLLTQNVYTRIRWRCGQTLFFPAIAIRTVYKGPLRFALLRYFKVPHLFCLVLSLVIYISSRLLSYHVSCHVLCTSTCVLAAYSATCLDHVLCTCIVYLSNYLKTRVLTPCSATCSVVPVPVLWELMVSFILGLSLLRLLQTVIQTVIQTVMESLEQNVSRLLYTLGFYPLG